MPTTERTQGRWGPSPMSGTSTVLLVGPISSAACALRTPCSPTSSQAKAQWTGAGFTCPGSVTPSSASGKFPSFTPDLEDLSIKVPPLPRRQEPQAEQIGSCSETWEKLKCITPTGVSCRSHRVFPTHWIPRAPLSSQGTRERTRVRRRFCCSQPRRPTTVPARSS